MGKEVALMVARVLSCTLGGLEALPVRVEVDVSDGIEGISIVGLPDASVRESRERVLSAMRNSGFGLPSRRVTISLAPGDLKKEGSLFDLPIALGLLAGAGAIPGRVLSGLLVLGELSLTGEITGREPAFPAALLARKKGVKALLCPPAMAGEASLASFCPVHPLERLSQAAAFLRGEIEPPLSAPPLPEAESPPLDLSEVRGQESAKRALEVAAAGGHHLLLVGPPGSGKTMLARRLPGILPPLSPEDSLEVTAIHSVAGLLTRDSGLVRTPPFRSPHHTISGVGLTGGGSSPRPGEVTLAHHGILFLDEMGEFQRSALESLRQPLEEGRITVTRAVRSATFPSRFLLAGATNPCPCGFLGHDTRPCRCLPRAVAQYRRKLSGALLDRVDIIVEVAAVPLEELRGKGSGEPSREVAARVRAARGIQEGRSGKGNLNGRLRPSALERLCPLPPGTLRTFEESSRRLGLTARGFHKILRVARTIADLEGNEFPGPAHIAEALQYRPALFDTL